MLKKKFKLAALVAGTVTAAVNATFAGYTTIAPPYEGEQSTAQILAHTYDSSFVKVGRDYIGDNYEAIRIQDTASVASRGGSPLPLTPLNLGAGIADGGSDAGGISANVTASDPTDQLWSGNSVIAVAQAKFALFGQSFGYFNGLTSSTYHPILDVSGAEYDVDGSGVVGNLNGQTFRFARTGPNATFSSVNSENPDDIDHMVTYQIVRTGVNANATSSKVYMLFWDDKLPTEDSDYDYNDMAIEIVVTSNNAVTPEPATVGVLSAGAALLLRRRRR